MPGGIGLAPEWRHRALTRSEERWVSACLYALTNATGKQVEVSLRATHPRLAPETLGEREKRDFRFHEGGFFGNLFAPGSPAYACVGEGAIAEPGARALRERACVSPASRLGPRGEPMSACGFILTGPCASPSSYAVGGSHFEEVVHVYLRAGR